MNSADRKLEKSSLPCSSRASTESRGEKLTSSVAHFKGSVLSPGNRGSAKEKKGRVDWQACLCDQDPQQHYFKVTLPS